ncbi:nitrilase-related carbon-nitrogen hydrolase [Bradyrhizobium sp. SZCCHNRI1003]|uniref:nitrilase-related carbon-nitrogen hydrolase n=1 Tax=Bradyrhizobium sp. SZCCHNRI1003 TaxID=3057275 RepID=UPI002916A7D0|nr:nitrilase-related carbon-nitrogen hydrolase [Bradyrhizobium sp. SZCCHNRI1003]
MTIVQLNSHDDVLLNLREAARLIRSAHAQEPAQLYILPEYVAFAGGSLSEKRAVAEIVPFGSVSRFFAELAQELDAAIYCGSINESDQERLYNSAVVFDRMGRLVAKYRKLYLMDATLPSGRTILESNVYSAGSEIITFELYGVKFGCSTCYDLRFPELFRAFRRMDVDVIVFAAAMPKVHGSAHLEVLLRARAIETQSYLLAANQCGKTANNTRESSGCSMIVDPWGTIEACLDDEVGCLTRELDLSRVRDVRSRMPVMKAADVVRASGTYSIEF